MVPLAFLKQRDDFYDISSNWLPLIGHRKPQKIRNVVSPCKTQPKRFKNVKNLEIILNHRDLLFSVFSDFCSVGSVTGFGLIKRRRSVKWNNWRNIWRCQNSGGWFFFFSIRNYPTCVFLTPQYRSLFKVKMWKNCLEISSAFFRAAFRFPQNRVSLQFQCSPVPSVCLKCIDSPFVPLSVVASLIRNIKSCEVRKQK